MQEFNDHLTHTQAENEKQKQEYMKFINLMGKDNQDKWQQMYLDGYIFASLHK